MDKPSEQSQGRRLLLAMAVMFFVIPLVAVMLLVPSVLLLEYIWGGQEAVARAIANWTEPSIRVQNLRFRVGVGLAACFSIGVPVTIWYRVFVSSGYISNRTSAGIDTGVLPVVGVYWKPFIFVGYVVFSGWAAYASFQKGAWFFSLLMAWGVYFFANLSVKEFLAWRRKSSRE